MIYKISQEDNSACDMKLIFKLLSSTELFLVEHMKQYLKLEQPNEDFKHSFLDTYIPDFHFLNVKIFNLDEFSQKVKKSSKNYKCTLNTDTKTLILLDTSNQSNYEEHVINLAYGDFNFFKSKRKMILEIQYIVNHVQKIFKLYIPNKLYTLFNNALEKIRAEFVKKIYFFIFTLTINFDFFLKFNTKKRKNTLNVLFSLTLHYLLLNYFFGVIRT